MDDWAARPQGGWAHCLQLRKQATFADGPRSAIDAPYCGLGTYVAPDVLTPYPIATARMKVFAINPCVGSPGRSA